MPAPSPARGSAPTAPRCSRLSRIVSASLTILCDLRPLMSAINPTPQESFSSAGSNRPKPDAFIAVLALLAGAPPPPYPPPQAGEGRVGADAIHLRAPFPRLPLAGKGRKGCAQGRATSSWRQPACRLATAGCLFLPPSDAPSPATADPASHRIVRPRFVGHQLGQQCCPMQNMANSGRQHKRHTPKPGEKSGVSPGSARISATFRTSSGSWDVDERNGRSSQSPQIERSMQRPAAH